MKTEITLEHLRSAVAAAKAGGALGHGYDQGSWCGTSCCLWGHAHLAACGDESGAEGGPPPEWRAQSLRHELAAGVMRCGTGSPDDLAAILDWDGSAPLHLGGNLYLWGSAVKSLGALTSVGGNLDLWGSAVKDPGALTSVGGNLDLWGSALGQKIGIDGWAKLEEARKLLASPKP